jgi:hypothetical protein
VEAVWKVRRAVLEKERAAELEGKAITIGDKTLKFEAREGHQDLRIRAQSAASHVSLSSSGIC